MPIRVPALRERLAGHRRAGAVLPRRVLRAQQLQAARRSIRMSCPLLERYDWPGNVRELRNVVERMAILTRRRPHHGRVDSARDPPAADATAGQRVCRRCATRRSASASVRRSTRPTGTVRRRAPARHGAHEPAQAHSRARPQARVAGPSLAYSTTLTPAAGASRGFEPGARIANPSVICCDAPDLALAETRRVAEGPMSRFGLLIAFVAFSSAPLMAQVPTGTIAGTVTDQVGAVLPNVDGHCNEHGHRRSRASCRRTRTAPSRCRRCPPARYDVSSSPRDFNRSRPRPTVVTGSTTTVKVGLELGRERKPSR